MLQKNEGFVGCLRMRIIIVGQGPFGEKVLGALIQKGEEVVGVFSPPDKRGEPLKTLAEKSNITVYQPKLMKDSQAYQDFIKLQPDLAILAFVTDIIPENILKVPSLGTICYHPSLLPRHRGASAINWAIIQGDIRTGLTIFWADQGIDTGSILLQKEVEIGPDETTGALYFNTLFPMGIEAIVEAVDLIKQGRAPRIPQDESKATYEPPCDDRVASINFEKPINEIYNLIRGCDPQPGAYTTYKGKRVRFYDARKKLVPTGKGAGEVVAIEEGGLQIAAQGGVIVVGKLRVDKGKVGPIEFAQSLGIKVGDRLGKD
ncbi:MAG: methionyl-tRNA formyltransferase [Deltaproteobacteria bacterium]|nr:methionyl-tRNA formyltransferase [Deltaproteobacteria bacterium]